MFEYESADIHPTTLVLHRWEEVISCGPGPEFSYLYLCNSAEDYITILSSLDYIVNDAPEGVDKDEYAKKYIFKFFKNLKKTESDNGGIIPEHLVHPLIAELNKHIYFTTEGVSISNAGIESKGTILNYLNDEEEFDKALTLLKYYCDENSSPDVSRIKTRLKKKHSFVLPGDEDP